ncbi:MAG: hypothetical protein JSV09_08345 [Thermoplasmata archaeon]|nr:MAG: hypothetical protein JSV09_08345 [Thermoplasmata archaeon]
MKGKVLILLIAIVMVSIVAIFGMMYISPEEEDNNIEGRDTHEIEMVIDNPTAWWGKIITEKYGEENISGVGRETYIRTLDTGDYIMFVIAPYDGNTDTLTLEMYDNGNKMDVPVQEISGTKKIETII